MKKIAITLLIALTCLLLAACSCSFTTANIQNAQMTTALGDNGEPIDTVDTYASDAAES